MTLKEKLKKEGFSNCDYLEQTADDYAIEFAEWFIDNCWYIEVDRFLYQEESFKLKELLEIFKKEKGL